MRVLVKEGAHNRGLNFAADGWRAAVKEIEGTWIEIETKCLFSDQFNTVPTRITKNGVRLMMCDVDAIEDDFRIGRSRCGWCGKHCSSEYMFCPHCGQGSLKPLLRRPNEVALSHLHSPPTP